MLHPEEPPAKGPFPFHPRTFLSIQLILAVTALAATLYLGRRVADLVTQRATLQTEVAHLQAQRAELIATKKALAESQKQLRASRDSSDAIQLGLRLVFSRRYTAAIASYDKAIAIDPTNPVPYNFKGYALLRSGRASDARESLEHAIAVDPKYVWGHYNLAVALLELRDKPAALQELRRVVALDPAFREVISGDGQFRSLRKSTDFRELLRGAA